MVDSVFNPVQLKTVFDPTVIKTSSIGGGSFPKAPGGGSTGLSGGGSTGLSDGAGAAISGGLQAAGSIFSAYMAAKSAKAQIEAEKNKHNADTRLNVAQYNQNQNRLAGLAGVASGQEQFNRNLATDALNTQYGVTDVNQLKGTAGFADAAKAYNTAGLNAAANATKQFKGKGDYSTLISSNYEVHN